MKDTLMLDVAKFLNMDLTLFDNTMKTTTGSLSDEMKTFYSDNLIDNAWAYLVHDQFGQKAPIPKNKGKIVEFRKYTPLAKATTALSEGVTPSGNTLTVSVITATVSQYGDYIELSDMLMMTAIDNNLVQATELLGHQAGETLDTITRNIISAGTNVQYADADVAARYLLVGGDATPSNNHYLTVNAIRRGVRNLKNNKAKKINGYYVGIIHPDVAYDLMGDDDWISASEYAGSSQLFEGEIGKIHGVRFVETTEAKIFHAEDLTDTDRTLTMSGGFSTKTVTVTADLSAAQATALVGRYVIIDGYKYTIASADHSANTFTISESPSSSPTGATVYPGEAGAADRDVYSTLILGENAYGVTEISGGGLETIVKQLGSAGSADPLNQRATVGWKATRTAIRLTETFMVRIETASEFESGAN